MSNWSVALLAIVVSLAAIAGAVLIEAPALGYASGLLVAAGELLAGMFVVALFIERTSAVIVGLWRRPPVTEAKEKFQAARRKQLSFRGAIARAEPPVTALTAMVSSSDPAHRAVAVETMLANQLTRMDRLQANEMTAADAATQAADELAVEDDKTVFHKQLVGLALSILVTAGGIRTLAALVEMEGIGPTIFRVADISITAGILAGGSAGIAQLSSLLVKYIRELESNATSPS